MPINKLNTDNGGDTIGNMALTVNLLIDESENGIISTTDLKIDNPSSIEISTGINEGQILVMGNSDKLIASDPISNFTDLSGEINSSTQINNTSISSQKIIGGVGWTSTNDGAGSGLDADLLDGVQGSNYARLDSPNTFNGDRISISFSDNTKYGYISGHRLDGIRGWYIGYGDGDGEISCYADNADYFNFAGSAIPLKINGNMIWHQGNDGAGSGLDADLLDGVQGSNYARLDSPNNFNGLTEVSGNSSGVQFNARNGLGNYFSWYNNSDDIFRLWHQGNGDIFSINSTGEAFLGIGGTSKIWHQGNDGAGSGLDANYLVGFQADFNSNGNTIVVRNAGGNVDGTYLRSTIYSDTVVGPTYYGDGYLYRGTASYFRNTIIDVYSKAEVDSNSVDFHTSGDLSFTVSGSSYCSIAWSHGKGTAPREYGVDLIEISTGKKIKQSPYAQDNAENNLEITATNSLIRIQGRVRKTRQTYINTGDDHLYTMRLWGEW